MTYKTLSDMAQFTFRTHDTFAEEPIEDVYNIFGLIEKAFAECSTMVGTTVSATTKPSFGGLSTYITISKLDNGEWDYSEQVAR